QASDRPGFTEREDRHDQHRLCQEPRRCRNHAWKCVAAWDGNHITCRRSWRSGCEHVRVYRFSQERIDRSNSPSAPATRPNQKTWPKADCKRLHVTAFCEGTTAGDAGGGCVHWARSSQPAWRNCGEDCSTTVSVARCSHRKWDACATIHRHASDVHSRLRDATV